ncbi:hypothetical protein HDV03_002934 [Kappamyces sp. JEL0829]|nr:hypothetical protein HDV03_002934 [Kappamyces sp. JEL0829]
MDRERIKELELEIAKKKAATDVKFGPGAWEEMQGKMKPHRCARHLDDFVHGVTAHLDPRPLGLLVKCFFTSETLPLYYPEATNSLSLVTELENLKRGKRE